MGCPKVCGSRYTEIQLIWRQKVKHTDKIGEHVVEMFWWSEASFEYFSPSKGC